jgi:MGT family glycosyltransferase
MSNIVVFMLWEQGHLLPTMRMCKDLEENGHQVTHVTIPDLLPLAHSRGFRAIPILTEFFPLGSHGRLDHFSKENRQRIAKGLAAAMCAEVVESQIEALQPDVILVDSIFDRTFAERLRIRGNKVVVLTTSLPHEPKGGLPGLETHNWPGGPLPNRLAIWRYWIGYFARQWVWHLLRKIPQAAPRIGIQTEEIVLCPEEFDFPRPRRVGRRYAGPSVELDRPCDAFDWRRLNQSAKLIYCSLGTQLHRYKALSELMLAVLGAVAQRQDEQVVIVADRTTIERCGRVPDNAILVERAPQIELLRSASVAITHGGLGTVKECILMGVPMIVFPQGFDQPGNAARIAFHRIGLRCIEPPFDTARVRSLLDELNRMPLMLDNIRRFQRVFQAAENERRGAQVVELVLQGAQTQWGIAHRAE